LQSYQLFINVKKEINLKVGKLGKFIFPVRYYVYTGSAKKNIDKRIQRHLYKKKKLHWHIDYLLNNDAVEIIDTMKSQMTECNLNKKTTGTIIIDGFGSSDCNLSCVSHLKYEKNIALAELSANALGGYK
tara:strand:- start:101 stop:490 length:390 start_codon:yes stop_codon:yes gene_type:complete